MSELYRRLNVHRLMERAYLSQPIASAGRLVRRAHWRSSRRSRRATSPRAREAVRANAETGKRLALEAIELAGGVL